MRPVDFIKPFTPKLRLLRRDSQETSQSQNWQNVLTQVEKQHFQGNRFDSIFRQGLCARSPRIVEALRKQGIQAAVYCDSDFPMPYNFDFPHAFVIMKEPTREENLLIDLSISQLTGFTNIPPDLNGFFWNLCSKGFVRLGENKENFYKYLRLISGCSEPDIVNVRKDFADAKFVLDKHPYREIKAWNKDGVYRGILASSDCR